MNALDIAISVAAIGSFTNGHRSGLVVRLASWTGGGVGVFLAARNTGAIARRLGASEGAGRVGGVVFALGVALTVGRITGALVGRWLRRRLPTRPLRTLDRWAGGAVGAVGVLGSLWLAAPALRQLPGWPASGVAGSVIVETMDLVLPPAPDPVGDLRQLVGRGVLPGPDATTGPPGGDPVGSIDQRRSAVAGSRAANPGPTTTPSR